GPPALAARDHDRIRPAQLAPVVAAAQPALQPTVFLLAHEGQMTRAGAHHLLGHGATELADQEQLIAHGSYELAAVGRPTYRLAHRPATPAALPAPVGTRAGCRTPARFRQRLEARIPVAQDALRHSLPFAERRRAAGTSGEVRVRSGHRGWPRDRSGTGAGWPLRR